MNPLLTIEGMVAELCVDLLSGVITGNGAFISLDPFPGTANGKKQTLVKQTHDAYVVYSGTDPIDGCVS